MHILIVEDDTALAAVLKQGFTEHNFRVSRADTFATARERMAINTYDLIILDEMLPGGSGTELCRDLRKQQNTTPVLMLTARDTIDDRVRGLDAGADDYLTKPFAFRELLARVRALGRRRPVIEQTIVEITNLRVDLEGHHVSRAGKPIELTSKEFALLAYFIQHRGVVVDRAAISAYVWDDNHDPFTNVLEVLIRRLRLKIDEDHEPKLIHTLRGAGYRFGP